MDAMGKAKAQKIVGSRGGMADLINIKIKRTTHRLLDTFRAENGLRSLDEAIALKFKK